MPSPRAALWSAVVAGALCFLGATAGPGTTGATGGPRATGATAGTSAFGAHAPSTRQHSEFVVEVNGKGQVVRARSVKPAHDDAFNALTYGNVLQAFIRRRDGSAVPGLYRMSYDYDPGKKMVRRQVALVRAGGVDPNALGAVYVEFAKIEAEKLWRRLNPPPTPSPLPDLKAITGHRH